MNLHIEAARKNAALGRPYTIQLPWYANGRWTNEFRTSFIEYWQALGSKIGDPVAAIPVPEAAVGFQTRALKVRPAVVNRVNPVDMNIVFQRLPLPPAERFDLIIGTNIFLYYGAFEQSLARANVSAMLKPGGYLLSNDKLQDTVPSGSGAGHGVRNTHDRRARDYRLHLLLSARSLGIANQQTFRLQARSKSTNLQVTASRFAAAERW